MILWRISNHVNLSGTGGIIAPARWHNAGRPIVYTASTPASALLEVLVHLELGSTDNLPDAYNLLQIEAPDNMAISEVSEADLDPQWKSREDISRKIGDFWLRETRTALLSVPSVIVPHTRHYLINPAHPDANRIRILSSGKYPYDSRLFK